MELFVLLTSFWVLAPILVMMVLMFVWVANETAIGATVTIVATFLVLQFFSEVPLLGFIMTHPLLILSFLGLYIVAGVIWSVVKWWLFCKETQEEYEDAKEDFFKRRNFTVSRSGRQETLSPQEAWREYCKYAFRQLRNGRLWARDHKKRIVIWMTYWPWSFVWTLIDDIVRRIFNAIYIHIQKIYQAIADNAFKNITKDFESSVEDK